MRFAVKPTSSILTTRQTIDRHGNETEIMTKGRHDPCVGVRAGVTLESRMAIVLMNAMLMQQAKQVAPANFQLF